MPLMHGKSEKAFSHNVKAEMDAGKPQKQSLAIAYNMKRKKMAMGGYAEGGMAHAKDEYDPTQHPGDVHDEAAMMEDDRMLNQHGEDEQGPYGMNMAEGGECYQGDEHEMDMVGRIMAKRQKHYSEGGRVANDTPPVAEFEDNNFDDMVEDDRLEGHYPGSQEHGNKHLDEEDHDMVSRIMRSRAKRDRLPNPA